MKIAILYSQPAAGASAEDLDTLVQAEAVERALAALGHAATRVGMTLDLAAARRELLAAAPDIVFNLVESLEGHDRLLAAAPLLLDAMGLPYAGSRATAMIETTNKLMAKRRMRQAGLPTPEWVELDEAASDAPNASSTESFLPARYILKSVWEHASFGMDASSVVEAAEAATLRRALTAALPRLGGEAFAERYIEGREFNLGLLAAPKKKAKAEAKTEKPAKSRLNDHSSVLAHRLKPVATEQPAKAGQGATLSRTAPESGIETSGTGETNGVDKTVETGETDATNDAEGPQLLPPAEIRFVDWEAGRPKLVDWRAKWDEASPEYRRTVRGQDFGPEDAPLLAELGELARRCWRLFGLGGWARVDFRVDEAGRPWILEVNANPCLSPDAGFAAALTRAGIPFEAAIERILADAGN
jgi:D-alanine-D-alanine ligase